MEIRVFDSFEKMRDGKYKFCQRVECPDAFDFNSCLKVFKSLFGVDSLVVFICN